MNTAFVGLWNDVVITAAEIVNPKLIFFLILSFLFKISRYRTSWWDRTNHWRPAKPCYDGPSAQRPNTRASASRISPRRGKTAWRSTLLSTATGARGFFFFSSFVLFHPVGRLLFEKINLNKIKEIKKKEAEKKCRWRIRPPVESITLPFLTR